MAKIPLHIVSGFLGSGKTTLVKRIIEQNASKQKIGIIQNEFAPGNIDGIELKKTGENFELLEINNGSVFCVCLQSSFTRSLEKFIDQYQPDVLVVEASGLSDTTSISEVISNEKLSEKIFLASNWCVVDAQNFSRVGLMKQRVCHQLRMADVVVVNKTDLGNSNLSEMASEIKKINPFADIRYATYCDIDFGLGDAALPKAFQDEVQALPRPGINSMVIRTNRKVEKKALIEFLNTWAPKAYRIKGYLKLKEGGTLAVQCVFDAVNIMDVESSLNPTEIIALSDQFSLREWNRAFKKL